MFLNSTKKPTIKPSQPKSARSHPKKATKTMTPPKAIAPAMDIPNYNDYFQRVMDNTKWLVGVLATLYFALSLWQFDMRDPSWSRSVGVRENISNWGGILGAYLSDIAYYLFGYSAWWIVFALVIFWYRQLRLLMHRNDVPYHGFLATAGVILLLLTSPMLEFFVFGDALKERLPLGAGGWIGSLLSGSITQFLGSVLGQFLVLVMALLAITFVVQISWANFVEWIGSGLEGSVKKLYHKILDDEENTQNQEPVKENKEKTLLLQTRENNSNRRKLKVTSATDTKAETHQSKPKTKPKTPSIIAQKNDDGSYQLPDVSYLRQPKAQQPTASNEDLQRCADLIETKLAEFGIEVNVVSAQTGPVITRFEIELAKGVKGSQVMSLSRDLARAMSMPAVRIVETIAGKNTMGIEVPNEHRQEVLLQEIFTSEVFVQAASKLTVALGKDIAGSPIVGDLAKMPHLLVGGMTGSGKSVGVNAMIMSLLFKATPEEVRMIMIDPKMLELSVYEGIGHLLCPVVTDMREAGNALNWCVAEMEKRYRLLSHVRVRNLVSYNEKIQAAQAENKPIYNPFSLNPDEPEPLEKLPYIVVIIDELADLMMSAKKAVEQPIARLAQKARAAGIHLIIATQRPSVDVITGLIKANVPTRMAFTVASPIDSRTILDQRGAEDLLGQGDSLFLRPGVVDPIRLQGAFVSDDEVLQVAQFVKSQGEPEYVDGLLSGVAEQETNTFINPESQNGSKDELFDQAMQFVLSSQKASISSLQRHLRIGYNRAANLMQDLEDAGVVSAAEADNKRRVLMRAES